MTQPTPQARVELFMEVLRENYPAVEWNYEEVWVETKYDYGSNSVSRRSWEIEATIDSGPKHYVRSGRMTIPDSLLRDSLKTAAELIRKRFFPDTEP